MIRIRKATRDQLKETKDRHHFRTLNDAIEYHIEQSQEKEGKP